MIKLRVSRPYRGDSVQQIHMINKIDYTGEFTDMPQEEIQKVEYYDGCHQVLKHDSDTEIILEIYIFREDKHNKHVYTNDVISLSDSYYVVQFNKYGLYLVNLEANDPCSDITLDEVNWNEAEIVGHIKTFNVPHNPKTTYDLYKGLRAKQNTEYVKETQKKLLENETL